MVGLLARVGDGTESLLEREPGGPPADEGGPLIYGCLGSGSGPRNEAPKLSGSGSAPDIGLETWRDALFRGAVGDRFQQTAF